MLLRQPNLLTAFVFDTAAARKEKHIAVISYADWEGSPSKPGFSLPGVVNEANYRCNPNLGASISLESYPPFQGCQTKSEMFRLLRSYLCLFFPLLSFRLLSWNLVWAF